MHKLSVEDNLYFRLSERTTNFLMLDDCADDYQKYDEIEIRANDKPALKYMLGDVYFIENNIIIALLEMEDETNS